MSWPTGIATDRGLQRVNNEDRVFVDPESGIFLVVDGIGGHAAGENAAEIAATVISEKLTNTKGDPGERIAAAVTAANNEIFRQAAEREEWRGMACVLTVVLAHAGRITVGHVGDTRLYLAWDGKLRKLTPDHSPVGEQEDQGELSEEEAMHHPRRNEVFRDVGSRPRSIGDDDDFVEIRSFPFRDTAAFLLCSDGLTDALTAARISGIIETYDGDPQHVAQRLVEAANRAGGNDNVSVVFVAGPEFIGLESRTMQEARRRHASTRPRRGRRRWLAIAERAAWLVAGVGLGIVLWQGGREALRRLTEGAIDPSDPGAIQKAVNAANPGDTVVVPPGRYTGPVELKDGVILRSAEPGAAIVKGGGFGFIARGLRSGRLSGFRIAGDAATGVVIVNSSIEVDDMDISGAAGCGVRIDGSSRGVLRANYIHDNGVCGVSIAGDSTPRLAGNKISGNGMGIISAAKGYGIEIKPPAHPILENNIVAGNGLAGFGQITDTSQEEIRSKNVIDGVADPPPGQPAGASPPLAH
jgi:parallel beta-helix repeat protein